jgi:hypothetical protein
MVHERTRPVANAGHQPKEVSDLHNAALRTRTPIFENWLDNGTDPPEGADPLLWELGQLRRVVQGAVVQSAKSRNHVATASLVRAGNGLLDLLAKIEKTRAEEEARKAAAAFTEDRQAIEDRLNLKLDQLAERMRQAEAMERVREQKMGKCLRCGQALPARGRVEGETPIREEPKPPGPEVH